MKKITISGVVLLSALLLESCGSENLHPVVVNGRYGYIDHSGKLAIAPQFDAAGEFSEHLAPISTAGKWGYIDQTGRTAITPQFDLADPFSRDELALVGMNGKLGYLKKDGQFAV